MFNLTRKYLLFLALTVISILALAGCSEDDVVDNNDVIPKICNLDLVQSDLTGVISVTYSITNENGGSCI